MTRCRWCTRTSRARASLGATQRSRWRYRRRGACSFTRTAGTPTRGTRTGRGTRGGTGRGGVFRGGAIAVVDTEYPLAAQTGVLAVGLFDTMHVVYATRTT